MIENLNIKDKMGKKLITKIGIMLLNKAEKDSIKSRKYAISKRGSEWEKKRLAESRENMDLRQQATKECAYRNGLIWTPEQIQFLKDHYMTSSIMIMSLYLGKTYKAVSNQLYRHNLRKNRDIDKYFQTMLKV